MLPAEERLTTEQTLEETMPEALGWNRMEQGAQFQGIVQAGALTLAQVDNGVVQRGGVAGIEFDENGFSADWDVFFTLEHDEEMVWTVQVSGRRDLGSRRKRRRRQK